MVGTEIAVWCYGVLQQNVCLWCAAGQWGTHQSVCPVLSTLNRESDTGVWTEGSSCYLYWFDHGGPH